LNTQKGKNGAKSDLSEYTTSWKTESGKKAKQGWLKMENN